jgi:cell division topological specificity factor
MASLLDRIFRRGESGSGQTAKQRLQLVLVTDRSEMTPEVMAQMKDEIIAVIAKYTSIPREQVVINLEQRDRDNWLVADIPLRRGNHADPLENALSDDA